MNLTGAYSEHRVSLLSTDGTFQLLSWRHIQQALMTETDLAIPFTSKTTFWKVDAYLAGLDACALQDMLDADVEGGLSLSACVLHADVHLLISAPHNLCTACTALTGWPPLGPHHDASMPALLASCSVPVP